MAGRTRPSETRTVTRSARSYVRVDTRPVVALYRESDGRWFPLRWNGRDYLTIGSDIGASIRLADRTVSEVHCKLEKRGDDVIVREVLRSALDGEHRPKNGTWINNIELYSEAVLRH